MVQDLLFTLAMSKLKGNMLEDDNPQLDQQEVGFFFFILFRLNGKSFFYKQKAKLNIYKHRTEANP